MYKSWIIAGLISAGTICQAQPFREISREIGVQIHCIDRHLMGGGVAFIDYNQDFYPDIFIIGGERPNKLYENNWDGTYADVTQLAGVGLESFNTVGVATGDIDNDGDDDLLVTTANGQTNVLLENNGDGTYTDISRKAGLLEQAWSTSASFGDFNLDGRLDIYVGNYASFEKEPFAQNIDHCTPNFLYQNTGTGAFIEVAALMGLDDVGCGLAVAFSDCDQDRDIDLHVANDFGLHFESNELYLNPYPQQGFRRAGAAAQLNARINAMGVAVGDYDEDGDLDYYITNIGDNLFFENRDQGHFFTDVAVIKQVNNPDGTSWGTAFLDCNNDTYLDLVVANGQVIEAPHQNDENRLFMGGKNARFTDQSEPSGLANNARCRGLSFADIDNDGDLDLMFGVVSESPSSETHTLIYENNVSDSGNWLKVRLQGTTSNRNGYGGQVRAVVGNRSLLREADGGSSYLSHSFNDLHFGLGSYHTIDSLIINWPGNNQDVLTDLPTNSSIVVVENSHWYYYRHETVSVFEGDSIQIGGIVRKEAGVYKYSIPRENGLDSILVISKLTVLDRPIIQTDKVVFSLAPNPFHTSVTLQYDLPQQGRVRLSIFDTSGKHISDLLDENQKTGRHWYRYEAFPSTGLYLFVLTVDDQVIARKGLKLGE